MKKVFMPFIMFAVLCFWFKASSQNIGINQTGAAPNASAMLDVQSTNKGMLIPRMTSAKRMAIVLPATGLIVFDNTTNSFWYKNTSAWVELTDSTNTVWTKKDAAVYVNNGENIGIGTSNPAVRLEVDNGTDVGTASGGYLQLGSTSSVNLAFDRHEILARNNGAPSNFFMQANGGNVGIGTTNADTKLQINNGTDVSTAAGGYLQLGASSLSNLAFDNNEIQARKNHAASTLYLQHSGNDVQAGSSTSFTTDVKMANGKLIQPATGNFNMMPLCYGSVFNDGSKDATPNVTVIKGNTPGIYYIKCSGISLSTISLASALGPFANNNTVYLTYRSNPVEIEAEVYDVNNGKAVDGSFSFVFYNP